MQNKMQTFHKLFQIFAPLDHFLLLRDLNLIRNYYKYPAKDRLVIKNFTFQTSTDL